MLYAAREGHSTPSWRFERNPMKTPRIVSDDRLDETRRRDFEMSLRPRKKKKKKTGIVNVT